MRGWILLYSVRDLDSSQHMVVVDSTLPMQSQINLKIFTFYNVIKFK